MKVCYKVLLSLDNSPMSWIVYAKNSDEAISLTELEMMQAFPDSIVKIKAITKVRE